jgi:hypothetical protein
MSHHTHRGNGMTVSEFNEREFGILLEVVVKACRYHDQHGIMPQEGESYLKQISNLLMSTEDHPYFPRNASTKSRCDYILHKEKKLRKLYSSKSHVKNVDIFTLRELESIPMERTPALQRKKMESLLRKKRIPKSDWKYYITSIALAVCVASTIGYFGNPAFSGMIDSFSSASKEFIMVAGTTLLGGVSNTFTGMLAMVGLKQQTQNAYHEVETLLSKAKDSTGTPMYTDKQANEMTEHIVKLVDDENEKLHVTYIKEEKESDIVLENKRKLESKLNYEKNRKNTYQNYINDNESSVSSLMYGRLNQASENVAKVQIAYDKSVKDLKKESLETANALDIHTKNTKREQKAFNAASKARLEINNRDLQSIEHILAKRSLI